MIYKKDNNKKTIGLKGENAVLDKLKTRGYSLYKKNIKYIDSEIDMVVYKYYPEKGLIDIRIIEVKTRNRYEFDLSVFNLKNKYKNMYKYIFVLSNSVKNMFPGVYYETHLDLVLVKYSKLLGSGESFEIYNYIKDINLML